MDLIDVINLNNRCSSNIHIQADMAPIKKFNPLPNKIININISTSVSFIQVYIKHVSLDEPLRCLLTTIQEIPLSITLCIYSVLSNKQTLCKAVLDTGLLHRTPWSVESIRQAGDEIYEDRKVIFYG